MSSPDLSCLHCSLFESTCLTVKSCCKTCYTPSHVGENTSHPQCPLILHVQVKKKQPQQKRQWLAGPNTVLPMCFTSISSSVKRQKHVEVPLSPAHFWSLMYFVRKVFLTHMPSPFQRTFCVPFCVLRRNDAHLHLRTMQAAVCQGHLFYTFNNSPAMQWWSVVWGWSFHNIQYSFLHKMSKARTHHTSQCAGSAGENIWRFPSCVKSLLQEFRAETGCQPITLLFYMFRITKCRRIFKLEIKC